MGIFLALLNPFLVSIQNAIAKVRLKDADIPDEAVVFSRLFYVVPIFAIFVLIVGLPDQIPDEFWGWMLLMIACEIPSQWYFHQALKNEQISTKIMPLAAMLAPLLVLVSVLFRGVAWNAYSLSGIGIFTCGFYLLNLFDDKGERTSLLEPIMNLFTEKSSRYMMFTIILWTVTTTMQKVIIDLFGQQDLSKVVSFMGMIYLSGASIGVLLVSSIRLPKESRKFPGEIVKFKTIPKLAPIGLIAGLAAVCQYSAHRWLEPAEMIALKETILVWAVLIDLIYFKEKIAKHAWLALPLILIGTILIGLGHA